MKYLVMALAGFSALAGSHAVLADDFRPHPYLAIGAGVAKAHDLAQQTQDEQRYMAYLGMSSDAEVRDLAASYRLTAGYRASPWLALETQLAWLGSYSADIRGHSARNSMNEKFEAKAYGVGLSAVFLAPVGRETDLFLKAGMFHSSLDASITTSGWGGKYVDNFSTHSTQPVWGAGLQFRSGAAKIRLEYESYQEVGKQAGRYDGSQVDVVTLSTLFEF